MTDIKRYLWLSDTHFSGVSPWKLSKFLYKLHKETPSGIFITGDISNGLMTCFHLSLLAKTVSCPIYFILGNHDYHFHSIEGMHKKIRELCEKYSNLIWLKESGVIHLSNEIALIGSEGWHDLQIGDPDYLLFTADWLLTSNFRDLNLQQRIDYWRYLSNNSIIDITNKLKDAWDQGYKTTYILTHFPPWKEATRDVGTLLENYWLPYNTNIRLGKALEEMMLNDKNKHIEVLCGHTHSPEYIRISKNIHCQVGAADLKPHIIYT